MNNKINIFIFSHSEIILTGMYSIINEIGTEPILIKCKEDFLDYNQLLGYHLIIGAKNRIAESSSYLEKHFATSERTRYLFLSLTDEVENELHINDSSAVLQQKIQNTLISILNSNQFAQNHELTPREIDVLKLLAVGFTIKEIANELIISTHTAISHRKNISEKLGIKTISGLTMYAVIKGVIEINDINPENLK